MKVSVDTNVLVRAVLNDDPGQSAVARKLLKDASLIAVSIPCLCEFAWVLRQGAKLTKDDVAYAIRMLLDAGNVVLNRAAAEQGLSVLEAGGDFADGAIAYEGTWLGGETFVSFDRRAVALLSKGGQAAQLLVDR